MRKQLLLSFFLLVVFSGLYLGCTKEEDPVRYSLSISITPKGAGSANPSGGTFDEDEQLSISAIPAEGYSFSKWSGDITGNSNPLNFRITSDLEITAEFVLIDLDGDGVPNNQDDCPNTPQGEEVDENGCSSS